MRRRTLLATLAAAAGTVGTAGCLGNGTPGGDGSGTGTDADGGGDGRTATPDAIRLESLDVGGSPGGRLPVRRPGQVALLDFFATWCAPCKPQMDGLREVRAGFPDVHMLSITSERDRAAVRGFWMEFDGTWPVALDPELRATEAYEATRVPTLLILAPDGTETWRHVGLAAADRIADELRAAGATGGGE